MEDSVMFVVFLLAGIMCDVINRNTPRKKLVITAYCFLAVCAMVTVIAVGSGITVPSPNVALETALDFFER